MLFIENNNTDPYQNHALEEWLMDHVEDDCFMLWRNDKAILLGKNQNAYNEINMPYAIEQGIKIVRRITGGGTVFTDAGNLMFTFISCHGKEGFTDFHRFTTPILTALNDFGIAAEFSGRNDLTINGKKFSGNAQCRYKNKVLHHGTLMYQANTQELAKALKVSDLKLRSKGVTSVQSRVTNISDHMADKIDIEVFRQQLFQAVRQNTPNAQTLQLTAAQWQEVKDLSLLKQATTEWIYGHSPQFDLSKETKLTGGIIEVFFNISRGIVAEIKIYGDFFGDRDIAEIEQALTGVLYEKQAIKNALLEYPLEQYFGTISTDEIISAFIST